MANVVEFPKKSEEPTEKLSEWVCPVCSQQLMLEEFKSGRGFLLKCKGSDAIPHLLRIYLQGFRPDAPFLPANKSAEKKAKLQQMLARVGAR